MDFVHLHLHTEKSLADAMLKLHELPKIIKDKGMSAVAITDHGNMFGVARFYQACKRSGIKPIIGMETYVAPRSNTQREHGIDDANYHLVLLCENNEGYQNLINISSDSSLSGMYYKPRTDKEKLKKWGGGLLALSSCLGGEVQQWVLKDDIHKATRVALEYDEIFGRGNFFLELQDHGLPEQKTVNKALIAISEKTGIPLVATNDAHYAEKEQFTAHDVLMAIQAKTTVDDTKRKRYDSDQFYVKTPEEMYGVFGYIPEALENTVKIAERCNVEIEFGVMKLPPFEIPGDYKGENHEYLREVCFENARDLYPEMTEEVVSRLDYELGVIHRMGYDNYFLITWDIFRFCEEGTEKPGSPSPVDWEPILVGPGRGSAAGSIVAYVLGITQVEPLQYGLLFERFLDPSRVSPPDC